MPSNELFNIIAQDKEKLTLQINQGVSSNDILMHFIQQGIMVESFNEILPSLNEIFIKLVEETKATTRAFQTV